MKTKSSSLIIVVMSIFSSTISAQSQDPSIPADSNSVMTAFDRNLNTMDWYGITGLNDNTKLGTIGINESFHSVLIKGSQNLIRDEQNLDGEMRRAVGANIYGTAEMQSNFVSDNRQIGLNSVGASSVMGGLSYSTSLDTVMGEIGNKWDRQGGIDDIGLDYAVHGVIPISPLDGSRLIPSVTLEDEQIFPRRNYDRAASVNYSQRFSPQSSVNFNGSYLSQLRAFYFGADSAVKSIFGVADNIEDRSANQSSFSAGFTMPILFFQFITRDSVSQTQINFTNRYKPRNDPANILYDTRIKVLNFDLSGQLLTEIDENTLSISMVHSERNETHAVINYDTLNSFTQAQISQQLQLNSLGTRNTLAGEIHLRLGNTSVGLTGLASLLRYDTPSDLNFDDRDELSNTLALNVNRQFSPFFQGGVGVEADLIHIVYIESQRSANNNRNFIYRLFPTIIFSDSRINSFNRFEVLANYTVYDFEAFSLVHSYSFRQASFLDSTVMKLSSKISAFVFGDLKLYTRGELYWSSFSEYPLNYFVDKTIWLSFYYSSEIYRCGIGYKYFALAQYNYASATTRYFASEQTNSGPTTFLSLNLSHLQLLITGWYQISWQTLQNPIIYPNFQLSVKYNI